MTRTDWGVPPAPSNQDPTPESTADRQQKVEHEPEYRTTQQQLEEMGRWKFTVIKFHQAAP